MFIGLCGALCSGKATVANHLAQNHGFTQLFLCKDTESKESETGSDSSLFTSADRLLDFVTKRWRQHWVLVDIADEYLLDSLRRRPFFLLVSVDAPIDLRWRRFNARSSFRGEKPLKLDEFVLRSDDHLFSPAKGITRLMDHAEVKLINSTSSLTALHDALDKLNLLDEERLRPSWDQYFMQLASLAAHRSNCMKRRVGCVLVRERRVISTGYNGTPRNLQNCNQGTRCNGGQGAGVGLSTCLCLHAEENALLEAGRERIRDGSTLYCDTCPCLTCSIKIAQVGISEVVYSQSYSMDHETASILREGNVKLRQYFPPRRGSIHLE